LARIIKLLLPLVTWYRWHWYFGATSFPNKDPALNKDLQVSVKRRLIRAARRIGNLEFQNEAIYTRLGELKAKPGPTDKEKAEIEDLEDDQIALREKISKACHQHTGYWNISRDTGMLDPGWGDREKFRRDYSQRVRRHQSSLVKT
jgi:hypothetical protein